MRCILCPNSLIVFPQFRALRGCHRAKQFILEHVNVGRVWGRPPPDPLPLARQPDWDLSKGLLVRGPLIPSPALSNILYCLVCWAKFVFNVGLGAFPIIGSKLIYLCVLQYFSSPF